MNKKKFTTKERFKILEAALANMYVSLEKLTKTVNDIELFLSKETGDN